MKELEKISPLPRLVALSPGEILTGGANQPMIVNCADLKTDLYCDCVIKFMGAERMHEGAAFFEVLAALIAREWGIFSVVPVLIEVTDEFLDTMTGNPLYGVAAKSIGLNFGSLYERNMRTIPSQSNLEGPMLQQAQLIFAFDLFIDNIDRTHTKPNCMANDQQILIFDHELAFSFISYIFGNPMPWELSEEEKTIRLKNSFFLSKIKGKKINESLIRTALQSIDDAFWEKSIPLIPAEWQEGRVERVRKHLSEIVKNPNKFINCIKGWLE